MNSNTTIADRSVLVTGANRGIGQALVEEALRRGAKRVYAGTRQPLAHPDERVTPLTLDVTDAAQIQAGGRERRIARHPHQQRRRRALRRPERSLPRSSSTSRSTCSAPTGVTQAFLPLLTRSRGAIVNNVSLMAARRPCRSLPAYSISKAAAFSLTQSLRALLAGRGVSVHAVLTGPTDTDMIRGFDIPKASPESVARAIFDGVENGEEDIFPDPMSQTMAESWRTGRGQGRSSARTRRSSRHEPARGASQRRGRTMTDHRIGTAKNGSRHARSCSSARRSTPGWVTSSPGSGASCRGCGSRRSTASTPTTGTRTLARAVRRALAAARLPLHVRPELRGRLPGQLVDRRHGRTASLPHLHARDVTLLLVSRAPLDEAAGLQAAHGLEHSLGLGCAHRLQLRPRLLVRPRSRRRECASPPMLESGTLPPIVEHNARATGTDVVGYLTESPGFSAFVLDDGAVYHTYSTTWRGVGVPDGLLPDPRPRAEGPRRGRGRGSSGSAATTSTRASDECGGRRLM